LGGAGHIGENEVLKVKLLDRPGGIVDRFIGLNDERALPICMALADDPILGW